MVLNVISWLTMRTNNKKTIAALNEGLIIDNLKIHPTNASFNFT